MGLTVYIENIVKVFSRYHKYTLDEFYGELKGDAMALLGLKRLKKNTRQTIYGFPMTLEERYSMRLVKEGIAVVIIREADRYIGKIKGRLPIRKIMPKKED